MQTHARPFTITHLRAGAGTGRWRTHGRAAGRRRSRSRRLLTYNRMYIRTFVRDYYTQEDNMQLKKLSQIDLALLMTLALGALLAPVAPAQAATPGTVVAWGDNTYGQSSVPAGLSSVSAIAAGFQHSLALKSDGTVVAWGDNTYGQS